MSKVTYDFDDGFSRAREKKVEMLTLMERFYYEINVRNCENFYKVMSLVEH